MQILPPHSLETIAKPTWLSIKNRVITQPLTVQNNDCNVPGPLAAPPFYDVWGLLREFIFHWKCTHCEITHT